MESTVSISKGVFVFNNGFKILPKQQKRNRGKTKTFVKESNIYSNQLWYKSFSSLWTSLDQKIQDLNNEIFSNVISNLVDYIKKSYDGSVNEIPTAALMTGTNMPDHVAHFHALVAKIKKNVTPHVAFLRSQDCQNVKHLVENMINQLINDEDNFSEEEEGDNEDIRNHIKKSQCSFTTLQAWYEDLYITQNKKSPTKKQKTKHDRNLIVLVMPDFESFNENVLQNFILIASSYINIIPIVLVFGIATSLSALHRSLPYHVSSKIKVSVFNSQPSTVYLNNVLEHILFSNDCPFHLGGKVFTLFTDIFIFYDLSVTSFINNFKYAMLEHYSYGNAMALCSYNISDIENIIKKFASEDCENVRRLLSFRKYVEKEPPELRIKLLTNDDYFKSRLKTELESFISYITTFHVFLKCLHILTADLPRSPLGKQIRELYSIATLKNITSSTEYKECMQLLGFQSKDELCKKISKIDDLFTTYMIKNPEESDKLKKFMNDMNVYINNLNSVNLYEEEASNSINNEINEDIVANLDRKQLKEKLLSLSKESHSTNKFEKMKTELIGFLSKMFVIHLKEPTTFVFHEIFFFNDITIQNQIVGSHRAAIHTALNDPQNYLQCHCCPLPNETAILPNMPDISIIYKLHLECGKMINLYDWLQAFLSIVDHTETEDESKRIVQPELQARFTQSVAELEFLGFIKSSKRKRDHVARLAWGG